jgi:hypothetical protein
MNTDLSPRSRLTALRSSEGLSWRVTGNIINWQGAVKLPYNARTLSEVPRREKGSGSASA